MATMTENPMAMMMIEAALRGGLGKKAAIGFNVTGPTTIGTAATDSITVEIIADTPEGVDDGATGVCGSMTIDAAAASAQITGRDLRRIVAGIVPATDTETSRYALGGTLVEIEQGSMLAVVGSDGRRMHVGHLQPSHIAGQTAVIVHADHWRALSATLRGAVRRILGLTGRKLDAAIDRGLVSIDVGRHAPTGGDVVRLAWSSSSDDGRLTVVATALALAGRFPRWRDILPQLPTGTGLTIDADAVADAVADFRAAHKAAEKAGLEAYMAEPPAAPRYRARKPGEYRHPQGLTLSAGGMTGRGCEWTSTVPAAPARVTVDPAYLADALDGAAAWSGDVVVRAADEIHAVRLDAGDEYGPRFLGVIMPMVIDD